LHADVSTFSSLEMQKLQKCSAELDGIPVVSLVQLTCRLLIGASLSLLIGKLSSSLAIVHNKPITRNFVLHGKMRLLIGFKQTS